MLEWKWNGTVEWKWISVSSAIIKQLITSYSNVHGGLILPRKAATMIVRARSD